MTVALTVATGLLVLVLLGFLGWALAAIGAALASIRRTLEKVAWGVRAIERQSDPGAGAAAGLAEELEEAAGGLRKAARALGRGG